MHNSMELDSHLEAVKAENKKRGRSDMQNTAVVALIGAALGYWAWQTVAHAAFAFSLLFTISAVGNRVSHELFNSAHSRRLGRLWTGKGCSLGTVVWTVAGMVLRQKNPPSAGSSFVDR